MTCPRCSIKGPLHGRALPKHADDCPHRSGRKRRQPELGSIWRTREPSTQPNWIGLKLSLIVTRVTPEEVQYIMHHSGREMILPRLDFLDRFEEATEVDVSTRRFQAPTEGELYARAEAMAEEAWRKIRPTLITLVTDKPEIAPLKSVDVNNQLLRKARENLELTWNFLRQPLVGEQWDAAEAHVKALKQIIEGARTP